MASREVDGPIRVAVVGAGHRGLAYASYAHSHPERMQVVAVADPASHRRQAAARVHGLSPEMTFQSYEELAKHPKLADAVINGTLDHLHYESTLLLLKSGYDVLLEKPIARTIQQVRELIEAARKHRRTVMICHVLRYAPFYQTIKRLIDEDEIGSIVSIHSSEHVSYHHMALAYVRGKWNDHTRTTPMILAKCCHDLDIIAWLLSGVPAVRVASFGSLSQFRPENAPDGSAERCLDGCQIEAECPYSARGNYIAARLWDTYVWGDLNLDNLTDEQKLESLRTSNPYGRCVWHCDNNVVDHQSVIVEVDNGVLASHDMFCATARPTRRIHIVGTKGEIEGDFEDGIVTSRRPFITETEAITEHHYRVRTIDVNIRGDSGTAGHGGGDARLIEDFVGLVSGAPVSKGVTLIEDSLTGHLIGFAAERARLEHRVIDLTNF